MVAVEPEVVVSDIVEVVVDNVLEVVVGSVVDVVVDIVLVVEATFATVGPVTDVVVSNEVVLVGVAVEELGGPVGVLAPWICGSAEEVVTEVVVVAAFVEPVPVVVVLPELDTEVRVVEGVVVTP